MKNFIEILQNTKKGKELYTRLCKLKTVITPELEKIIEIFPEYLKHDITHSENIIENLNIIISDKLKEDLNEYEIYFLLCSTYLHDVGMALLEDEIEDDNFEKLKDSLEELKQYIRDNHHVRSEVYVNRNYQKLHIANHHEAAIIGKICKGHRKIDLSSYETDYKYKHYSINKALLTSFLRIADELDITYDRIPLIDNEIILPENEVSREHWKTHLTISGTGLDMEDPLTIKCSAKCEDPSIHRTLKRLESKINKQIYKLPEYIRNYREHFKEIPRRIIIDIEAIGYKPYDFKFTIESRKLLSFLSKELYKNYDVAIRELLKNSIDACRSKKEICNKENRHYNPYIKFVLSDDKQELTVDDNGIGMDSFIVDNFLTKIGKSYYNSQEFIDKGLSFSPVSELGLGILSYFLLANRIIIDTKTDNSDAIQIEIFEIDDYFIVRNSSRVDSGSTIKLHLKEIIKENIDFSFSEAYQRYQEGKYEGLFYYEQFYLDKVIKKFAKHIEIPIIVKFKEYEDVIENKGFKLHYVPENIYIHKLDINEKFLEGILVFIQENPQFEPKVVLFSEFKSPNFNYTNSYEGVYIEDIPLPLSLISSRCLRYDFNFKNNSIDLNIARDNILINKKFGQMREKLEILIIEELPKFLQGYIQYLKDRDIEFEPYIREFFHKFLIYPLDSSHDNLIRDFYFFKLVENGKTIFKSYKNTLKIKDDLIIIEILEEYEDKKILYLLNNWEFFDLSKLYLILDFGLFKNLFENIPSYEIKDENIIETSKNY